MQHSSNFPRRSLALALVVFGSCLLSAPAAGQVGGFRTEASAGTQVPCPVQVDESVGPYQSAAEVGCNHVVEQSFADVRGSSQSALGLLRSEAILNSKGQGADAFASARYRDTLVINAPGLAGTIGQLLIRMPLDGKLSADFGGGGPAPLLLPTARVLLEVTVESPPGVANPLPNFEGFLSGFLMLDILEGQESGVLVLPIRFVFGQPFRIFARLGTLVETQVADASQNAFASSRYGSTAWWLGVENVRLENGLPVLEFEVVSDSGIDYGADSDGKTFELLHSGGDFVTHPGQGAGGSDASMVGSNSPSLGFGVRLNPNGNGEQRIADRFVLSEERTVERIVTYAYESNVQTPAWTGFNLNIWQGRPGDAGSQLLASTVMGAFDSTGSYRVSLGAEFLENTARPIYAIQWILDPLTLPAGEYWIDWQVEGGSSAFAVPAMAVNPENANDPITVSGLARHLVSAGWQNLGAPDRALATPFQVLGAPDPTLVFRDGFE
jgi:hypothetical protein